MIVKNVPSKARVNKIGQILRNGKADPEYGAALDELNRWREAHMDPMDDYFKACEKISQDLKLQNVIIAQRLKRLPTILDKLSRFESMKLSSMQDIGGVRIIVNNPKELELFEKEIIKLVPKSEKDYILNPKTTGYRGKHFIFVHESGMMVEVQLRTALEHLWATSVETMDVFLGTAMKTRNNGGKWQEFFELVSSMFAYFEGYQMLPQHQKEKYSTVYNWLVQIINDHHLIETIETYVYSDRLEQPMRDFYAHYAVLTLSPDGKNTDCHFYLEGEQSEAAAEYERREREKPGSSVLISLNDIDTIKDAYPNYFLSMHEFIDIVKWLLEKYSEAVIY